MLILRCDMISLLSLSSPSLLLLFERATFFFPPGTHSFHIHSAKTTTPTCVHLAPDSERKNLLGAGTPCLHHPPKPLVNIHSHPHIVNSSMLQKLKSADNTGLEAIVPGSARKMGKTRNPGVESLLLGYAPAFAGAQPVRQS